MKPEEEYLQFQQPFQDIALYSLICTKISSPEFSSERACALKPLLNIESIRSPSQNPKIQLAITNTSHSLILPRGQFKVLYQAKEYHRSHKPKPER